MLMQTAEIKPQALTQTGKAKSIISKTSYIGKTLSQLEILKSKYTDF